MMIPAFAGAVDAAIGTWLSPIPGEPTSSRMVEVAVGYNTQSSVKVTRLELWVDGRMYERKSLVEPETRGVCSFWWDTARATRGGHDLQVKIYAGDKLISRVSSAATVGSESGGFDLRPPVVRFSNIRSGDVLKGRKDITIEANDDSGDAPIVSMLVDNSLKLLTNTRPYSYSLDTTQYADGGHQLQTYAYDKAGNKSDVAVVKVQFQNGSSKPVVASVTVRPERKVTAASEDDFSPRIPAPEPARTESGAARADSYAKVQPASTPVAVAQPAEHAQVAAPAAVELPRPKASEPVQMAMNIPSPAVKTHVADADSPEPSAAAPSLETQKPARSSAPAAPVDSAAAEPEVNEAVAAAAPTVQASAEPAAPRSSAESDSASGSLAVPDVPVDGDAIASLPQPVRVAMLPSVKSAAVSSHPEGVIYRPATHVESPKARIKELQVPISGKMKLRDIFNQMGGVLFWNSETRTVTGYVGDMVLEMKIGSTRARVNGKPTHLLTAPVLANGRTIIDAGVYHQVCRIAEMTSKTASAK